MKTEMINGAMTPAASQPVFPPEVMAKMKSTREMVRIETPGRSSPLIFSDEDCFTLPSELLGMRKKHRIAMGIQIMALK